MYAIRPAVPAERESVAALVDAAYSKWIPLIGRKPAPMLADYERLIADGVVYVAANGESLVGVLVIWPVSMDGGDAMLVENVCVHPGFQRGGVGRALLDFAEARAREAGLSMMRLYTNVKFESNQAYYRKLGYVETRREVTPQGHHLVWMHKQL